MMKTGYCKLRGWHVETGVPTKATALRFGLDDIAADFASIGILPDQDQRRDGGGVRAPSDPRGRQ